MSEKDNGGPAFPVGFQHGESIAMKGGMALRDYFAAKAIPALIANSALNPMAFNCSGSLEMCATSAYEIADAMLRARAK